MRWYWRTPCVTRCEASLRAAAGASSLRVRGLPFSACMWRHVLPYDFDLASVDVVSG